MNVGEMRQLLGLQTGFIEQEDGYWGHVPNLDVRRMAQSLFGLEARLITITARPSGDECRLIYHWDWQGKMLHLSTLTHRREIESIADLYPAADWIEREIHDLYAVVFAARVTPPLLLRPNDAAGLFLRNGHPSEESEK